MPDTTLDADVSDPEAVVEEYEEKLDDVLATVDDPVPGVDDEPRLELAGLELDRRDFLKAGAVTGAVGATAGCLGNPLGDDGSDSAGSQQSSKPDHSVAPGDHDQYYGFWSGGHSGEVRVVGVPSMRELIRIPVFEPDGATGFGHDDETSEMLEETGDVAFGDAHHPVLSESGGDYDGRYLWINDKANGRMARIDLTYFETDAITEIPNMQACHGCAVQSPDTKYVYGVGEFRTPVPNDGTNVDDTDKHWSTFTALDPESMEVAWQVRVSGNLDNADTGKDGRWAFATGYNKEEALDIQGMTHDDRDYLKAFDVDAIESAIQAGNYEEVNGVKVLDGRKGSSLNSGSNPIVRYVPVPKSPHGCDVTPDGTYVTASGKLSPTVTIVDIEKLDSVSDPANAVVGQPKVGLGPLHTTWDGRGHGYTSVFIDSQVVKWDVETAVEAEKNSTDPVLEKIDVHYNPGHVQAVEGETTDPAGDWLVSLNKLSKDRFLPVGPIHPDNDQLIHIGDDGGGMELVMDEPVHPEPHDCVFVDREKLDPATTWNKEDYAGEKPFITAGKSGVERTGEESVHVKLSSKRSEFSESEFRVQEGDEVTLTVTNIEGVRDIIHGVAIPQHGVNLAIAPQDTRQVTFTADDPGVYWVYCTYFCSALHLEMRSRLIVEPSEN